MKCLTRPTCWAAARILYIRKPGGKGWLSIGYVCKEGHTDIDKDFLKSILR